MTAHRLGLALAATACASAYAEDPTPALETRGVVIPATRATISAPVSGILSRVLVKEGQAVKKGELLAVLDDTGLRLALRVAEAKAVLAKERLAASVKGWEAERELLALDRERTRHQLDRLKRLQNSASEAELRVAEADVKKADVLLSAHERRGERDALKAEVRVAEAELDVARRAAETAALLAPLDGVVVHFAANVGELVRPDRGVAEIADLHRLEVLVHVAAAQLDRIAVGQNCTVTLGGMKDTLAGKVGSISPVIDPKTETAVVRVELAPQNRLLRPGSTATVTFLKADK